MTTPRKYKFVSSFDKPEDIIVSTASFLQIASFPNPKNKLYHIKKFIINQNNEFIDAKEYFLNKNKYEKLLKIKRKNEYKLYAVYDLNTVNVPSLSDILMLRSTILGSDHYNYGFAPFN
jgi:hypothetical protein